ncbi:MAG: redox-sensing transcriptional repressor Rex [Verrucomicrobiota bacterium]
MKEKTDSKSRRARSSSVNPRTVAGAGLPPDDGGKILKPAPADADNARKAGMSCVKRLPSYLQLLRVLQADGHEHVSGTVLATVHNLEPVIVRKDLAITGIIGTPRIGFRVSELIAAIERFLGWDSQTKAILVGTGNLGAALLGYRGFDNFGLHIIAAFDSDQKKIGTWVHGCKVQSVEHLAAFVRRGRVLLGVLTVPAEFAQPTAERMIAAGIRGIWNFTPVKLQVPADVVTQKEDLAEGLAVLSHRMHHVSRSAPIFNPAAADRLPKA